MIPLYTSEQFESSKSRTLLPLQCHHCNSIFHITKNEIQKVNKRIRENKKLRNSLKYCSRNCVIKSMFTGKLTKCKQCDKEIYRQSKKLSENNFCSTSCSASYNNTHKKFGYRRSKLEIWIENQLKIKYPNLEFKFNDIEQINSELDIYIPTLKIAFELNGIFHYEQIYGNLSEIQEKDSRKFQKCIKSGIELCVIDTSSQKKFTEKSSYIFLDIITNIVDKKWGVVSGLNRTPQESQS